MAKPYIQVELDALNKVPLVARATGANPDAVLAGLIALWAHCYREKANVVRIPELRGFFGAAAGIVEALVSHGFVEDLGDRLRVRGVDRYSRLAETRADAGRKGGQATQKKASPKRGDGGRFAGVTEAPRKQLLPSSESAASPATEAKGSSNPASTAPPTVDHGSNTEAIASVDRSKTEATRKQPPKQNDDSPKQNQALYPRSESLSPAERETLSDSDPLPRSADATPLGAGREPRQETSEGTRVDPPAPPPRPAPAPKPLPVAPPKTGRVRLWSREELPPSPPDEDFVGAVAWRLKLLATRDAQRDEATVRTIATPMFEQVASDLEPLCPGEAGLMVLCDLDDYLAEGALMPVDAVEGWIRARVFAMVRGGEMAELIDDEEGASASIH